MTVSKTTGRKTAIPLEVRPETRIVQAVAAAIDADEKIILFIA